MNKFNNFRSTFSTLNAQLGCYPLEQKSQYSQRRPVPRSGRSPLTHPDVENSIAWCRTPDCQSPAICLPWKYAETPEKQGRLSTSKPRSWASRFHSFNICCNICPLSRMGAATSDHGDSHVGWFQLLPQGAILTTIRAAVLDHGGSHQLTSFNICQSAALRGAAILDHGGRYVGQLPWQGTWELSIGVPEGDRPPVHLWW